MKKLLFSLLLSVPALLSAQTVSLSKERMDTLLMDKMFDTSMVGLMVWDLTADSLLYHFNERQLMRPASTMKLLTAIAACDQLGTDYQFTTRFLYTGKIEDHRLKGDIYCVGGMDPLFSDEDIEAVVKALRELGVNTFEGNIFADLSAKDDLKWGEGWCWDDDNPSLSPLLVERYEAFTDHLVEALLDNGVAFVNVGVGHWSCPEDAIPFCTRTHSINAVMKKMMKDSDNLYAESMFYQLAMADGNRPANADEAKDCQRRVMKKAGLNPDNYRLADGSGLSLYNYLSAEAEVKLLRYVWNNKPLYNQLLPSLPIAGIDGTLKSRMKETSAEGNVMAKTGTVTGVSSLAGYCTAPNGNRLCFAIINQGIMRAVTGRNFQDRVCILLTSGELPQAKVQPKPAAKKKTKRKR